MRSLAVQCAAAPRPNTCDVEESVNEAAGAPAVGARALAASASRAMIVRTDAVVLRTLDYGETSRIVTLLTRAHGVVGAIARGARRPTSRFGSTLQPMACVEAVLYHKPGRGLQTLKEAAHLVRFPALDGSDLGRVTAGLRAVEAARLALDEGDAHPLALDRLIETLAFVDAAPAHAANGVPWFQMRLAALLGVGPAIDRDDVLAVEEEGGVLDLATGAVEPVGAGPDAGFTADGERVRASRAALRAFAVFARTDLGTAGRLRLDDATRREVEGLTDAYLRLHAGSPFRERVRGVADQMDARLDAAAPGGNPGSDAS